MIKQIFEKAKKENRPVYSLFVGCGDTSIEFTEKLVEALASVGVELIELGLPFSDPTAGGAIIQESYQRALLKNTNVLQVLDMVERLRKKGVKSAFVLSGYYNVYYQMGVEKLAKRTKEVGAQAWLIADLPLEQMDEVLPSLKENSLDFIALVSHATPLERVMKISQTASGYLYHVENKTATLEASQKRLQEVKEVSALPVGANFGYTTKENIDAIFVDCDFVDLIHKTLVSEGEDSAIKKAKDFAQNLLK